MEYVHISAKVEYRIEGLRKTGKAGAALAQKATRLIESLASGAVRHRLGEVGSYTKYGEGRIRNCRKFDLGCGFRLITLQRGKKVFVPFLGTHDECQRWLDRNSRMKEFVEGNGRVLRIPGLQRVITCEAVPPTRVPAENTADTVMPKVTETELRQVFHGLVDGARLRQRGAPHSSARRG